ncbi:MAG: hypothetical protein A2169_15310 [Deltaproteobacteria bacterium RBG_13_47_9]|nr:MAG: hypothetical protein A2169_15310 [Deltaproteobacteria bacterium RBG_13_47_9]
MDIRKTFCSICNPHTHCGINAYVEQGELLEVEGMLEHPTKAIQKRMEDGLVLVDLERCIGCKMCMTACPFGIPQFGRDGKMRKCDFCSDRLEKGLNPVCMNVCPTRALHAGPLDELSSMTAKKSAQRLNQKTEPSFLL